jgi:hypothetical protein
MTLELIQGVDWDTQAERSANFAHLTASPAARTVIIEIMTDKGAKLRYDRDRARDILKEFIDKPNVYPSVHYPEYTYDSLHSLTSLFDYPYVVWLPETHNILEKHFEAAQIEETQTRKKNDFSNSWRNTN